MLPSFFLAVCSLCKINPFGLLLLLLLLPESGETDRQTDRDLCKDLQNLRVHSPLLENLGDGRLHLFVDHQSFKP
jgi:hypothetical protein